MSSETLAPTSPIGRWIRHGADRLIRDPRDLPLFEHAVRGSSIVPAAIGVFAASAFGSPAVFWIAAAVFILVYAVNLERFITMFHDVNHNRLFKPQWWWLDTYLQVAFGTLYGSTPYTYFVHHVLMHHPTENGIDDESTTLPYRRDSLWDFARYFARFWGSMLLVAKFARRRYPKTTWPSKLVAGEVGCWVLAALGLWFAPGATAIVLLLPTIITRSLMIAGTWGEHAFVDPKDPMNPYRSSLDLRGPLNERCFNVGYHIGHHIRPGAHFTSQPQWFEEHAERLAAEDSIVLRDLHYYQVTALLLLKQYSFLADRYVQLPGAPERDRNGIIALLRERTEPVHAS